MSDFRYVKPNAAGGWDVLKEGDRRAAVQAETRDKALRRARDVVSNAGGGEIRVLNAGGKVVESRTVPSRRSARTRHAAG